MADEKAAEAAAGSSAAMETDEEGPNSASSPKLLDFEQNETIKTELKDADISKTKTQNVFEPMDGSREIKLHDIEEKFSPRLVGRSRTYSAGQIPSMTLNVDCSSTSPSPIPVGSPAPRVIQIRREESVDELTREFAKERDITSAINLSRSWDELSWLGGDKNYTVTNETRETKRDSIDEMMFNSGHPEISSPVRFIDKEKGISQDVDVKNQLHHRSLTPSPISVPISPKQRTFRRSLSPSSLRPSLLASKRKLDPDDSDAYNSPAKRSSSFYSPVSTLSSISSSSSPDHQSDSYTNHRLSSCDDDSGSECFIPQSKTTCSNFVHSPLTCDTRLNNHQSPFAFVKPRYVAPQSPLAAGVSSAGMNNVDNRKATLTTNYTSFASTTVKESAKT